MQVFNLLACFGGSLISFGGGPTFTSDSILTRSKKIATLFIHDHILFEGDTPTNKAPMPVTEGSGSNNSGGITINIYGGEHRHYYGATTSSEPSFGSQPPRDEEPGWWSMLVKLLETFLEKMWAKLRSEIASWLADRLLGSLIRFGAVCVGAIYCTLQNWALMEVVLLLMQ
ncbi:hypothetical protein ACUH95_06485 [Dermabacteraceae bacterium P13101]